MFVLPYLLVCFMEEILVCVVFWKKNVGKKTKRSSGMLGLYVSNYCRNYWEYLYLRFQPIIIPEKNFVEFQQVLFSLSLYLEYWHLKVSEGNCKELVNHSELFVALHLKMKALLIKYFDFKIVWLVGEGLESQFKLERQRQSGVIA